MPKDKNLHTVSVGRFSALELHPIKDNGEDAEVCEPENADYWSVYGLLDGNNDGSPVLICIGDFDSKESAELVIEMLGGRNTLEH